MTGRRSKIRCRITQNTIVFIWDLGILLIFVDVVDTCVTAVCHIRISIKTCCCIAHWLYCRFQIGIWIFPRQWLQLYIIFLSTFTADIAGTCVILLIRISIGIIRSVISIDRQILILCIIHILLFIHHVRIGIHIILSVCVCILIDVGANVSSWCVCIG